MCFLLKKPELPRIAVPKKLQSILGISKQYHFLISYNHAMAKVGLLVLVLCGVVASIILFKNQTSQIAPLPEVIPMVPRKIYLGAWVQDFWDSKSKTLATSKLIDFEEIVGKKMAIATLYSEWNYLRNPELLSKLEEISSHGWVPLISSNPYFMADCPEKNQSLYATIASGQCDAFLREVIQNLKAYQKPVFLRFAWEMNLKSMYWSIPTTKSQPEEFVAAWKHFHDIGVAEGADNIIWNLSFNTSSSDTIPYAKLYPGDEYVDWVSIDGYNWGTSQKWSGWTSFEGVFRNSYNELAAISNKPIMISEFNSSTDGGDKAAWLQDALEKAIPEKFPLIKAIVFFNENKIEGESVDWRIEKSPEFSQATKVGLTNSIYVSNYP